MSSALLVIEIILFYLAVSRLFDSVSGLRMLQQYPHKRREAPEEYVNVANFVIHCAAGSIMYAALYYFFVTIHKVYFE